jgi:hypothetical protein
MDISATPDVLSLDDEQIINAQPAVRGLLLQRLEAIWKQVADHLDPDLGADPRWAEIGLRVLDREARLYRLDKVRAVEEVEEMVGAGVDRHALVAAQLQEIAVRLGQPS